MTAQITGAGCGSAILGASDYLHLAAAPTFVIMALLTGAIAHPDDVLCSAAHDVSPLTGMVAMYVLMSIFHLPPWLKLLFPPAKRVPTRPVFRMRRYAAAIRAITV
jgi:hypothetical protein